jgi:hypothetical protein
MAVAAASSAGSGYERYQNSTPIRANLDSICRASRGIEQNHKLSR